MFASTKEQVQHPPSIQSLMDDLEAQMTETCGGLTIKRDRERYARNFPHLTGAYFGSKLEVVEVYPPLQKIVARVTHDFRHNRRGYLTGEYVVISTPGQFDNLSIQIIF